MKKITRDNFKRADKSKTNIYTDILVKHFLPESYIGEHYTEEFIEMSEMTCQVMKHLNIEDDKQFYDRVLVELTVKHDCIIEEELHPDSIYHRVPLDDILRSRQ